MSPEVLRNSRKQRFLALASRHGHTRTLQPLSSPPRLLCRSPGPGPSVSSLSSPKPSLFWVMKPTLAHTTALTASYTPVSPTDTAGTHSHFTHAQAQPHQSTALLRMGKVHHLVTQVASGSSLHSAPLQRSRALATTDSTRRRQAFFEVRLVNLLWPQQVHQTDLKESLPSARAVCRGESARSLQRSRVQ